MDKERRGIPPGGKAVRSRRLGNLRAESLSERSLKIFDTSRMQATDLLLRNPQIAPQPETPDHVTTEKILVYSVDDVSRFRRRRKKPRLPKYQ